MADSQKNKIKLNLGCGLDYREGYINVDSNPSLKTDVCADIQSYTEEDNSVDEILLSHVVMYLRPEELSKLLQIFHYWLKPDGFIEIETINFDQVMDYAKQNDKSYGLDCIFGTEVTQTHRWGWNITRLRDIIIKNGFKNLEIKDGDKNPRRDFKIIAYKQ